MTAPSVARIAELRRLAEAATSGPWRHLQPGDATPDTADHLGPTLTFIAAADPQTILALLDAHDALRAALEEIINSEPGFERNWDGWREVTRLEDIARAALAKADDG